MNEETAARVARVVASFRSGVYVSRETLQELLADIHDAREPHYVTDNERVDFLSQVGGFSVRPRKGLLTLTTIHGPQKYDAETVRGCIDAAMKGSP